MKLAMSNIGWERHDDPDVLAALRAAGVTGIEVAPTKVWPEWQGATAANARVYREQLAELGFEIPAMQAILFGKPELRLFDPEGAGPEALVEHIERVADLAQAFGAKVLVFGAPKSRLRGALSSEQAFERAVPLFAKLGAVCAERETCLCIEPNPVEYGCDFMTDATQALSLVERVDSPGFGMHFDAAALHMARDPFSALLSRAQTRLRHYHVSEPYLTGFEAAEVPHARWLAELEAAHYPHWASVEVDAKKHQLAHTLMFVRSVLPAGVESAS